MQVSIHLLGKLSISRCIFSTIKPSLLHCLLLPCNTVKLQLSTVRAQDLISTTLQLLTILFVPQNQKSIIWKESWLFNWTYQVMLNTILSKPNFVKAIYSVHGWACTLQTQTHLHFNTTSLQCLKMTTHLQCHLINSFKREMVFILQLLYLHNFFFI